MAISVKKSNVSSQNVKIQDIPNVIPTITSVTNGPSYDGLNVNFTIPTLTTGGKPEIYRAISSPGGFVGTSTSSPIEVRGLTPGTNYTFTVTAESAYGANIGTSAASSASTPSGAMVPIATYYGDGTNTGPVFSNIPQTYQDLKVVMYMRSNYASATGYSVYTNLYSYSATSQTWLIGNGSSLTSSRTTNGSYGATTSLTSSVDTSGIFTSAVAEYLNYKTNNQFKTILLKSATDKNGSGEIFYSVTNYRTYDPVTTITVATNGNFITGTVITLYGIKGANK